MLEVPLNSFVMATAWKRIVAYLVDYLVIGAYFGIMSGIYFALRGVGVAISQSYDTVVDKIQGQAIAIVLFTLPVICYFALLEASAWRASIGKRLMRLQVVGMDGQRISRAKSFLRSTIKFAPWEIAHTGIWFVTGQPFVSPPSTLSRWAWGISLLFASCWIASLFIGGRRTPYDWIAQTRVEQSSSP